MNLQSYTDLFCFSEWGGCWAEQNTEVCPRNFRLYYVSICAQYVFPFPFTSLIMSLWTEYLHDAGKIKWDHFEFWGRQWGSPVWVFFISPSSSPLTSPFEFLTSPHNLHNTFLKSKADAGGLLIDVVHMCIFTCGCVLHLLLQACAGCYHQWCLEQSLMPTERRTTGSSTACWWRRSCTCSSRWKHCNDLSL